MIVKFVESLQRSSTSNLKVNGLNWKTDHHEFTFDLSIIYDAAKNLHITKQMTDFYVFRLIGINSVYYITTNFHTKNFAGNKFEWDKVINDRNITDTWSKFLQGLGTMHFLNASRYVLQCEERRVEIHKFSDSLRKGYGACVFVCVI